MIRVVVKNLGKILLEKEIVSVKAVDERSHRFELTESDNVQKMMTEWAIRRKSPIRRGGFQTQRDGLTRFGPSHCYASLSGDSVWSSK